MHSTKLFNKFFYAVTIVAFIFQLIMPTTVYADGEDPTPEPAPTSIPVDEATPAPTEEITPLPTDLVIPEGTDLVVLDENGQPLPLATEAAAEVLVQGDPIWCPVGATPVALTNGCTDSYASLTALLAAANESAWGDGVIWIEDGAINDVAAVSINGAANTHSLTLNGGWTGGTTLNAATPSTFVVPINIFWGGAVTINNLTLDGKDAGDVEAMLNVQAVGDVTMSNVTVTNSQGTTGTVNADAVVNWDEVADQKKEGYGAKINTTAGGVTVSNSTFTYNNHNGLYVISKGPVTLTTITAYGNGGQRDLTGPEKAAVEAAHHTGQSSDSRDNWDATKNEIIDDVTYYNHVWWGSGVQVSADTGNVSVSRSTFGDIGKANKDSGLVVNASAGNITLTRVTSYGNFGYGADLFASAGNILVEESDFLNTLIYKMGDAGTGGDLLGWWDHANYWNGSVTQADWKWQGSGAGGIGLSAYGSGDITLNKIHAGFNDIGNQYSGANLASYNGQISVTDSEFIENGISGSVYGGGLFADSGVNWQTGALSCVVSGGCDITLTNVTVNENYGSGAEIFAYGGGVTVQGTSTFNLNGGTGLTAEAGNWDTVYCPAGSVCDLTITDAIASENDGDGVYLYSYFGNIIVDNVTATGNADTGANLGNEYGGNVTVSNSHFNSNSAGVYVETGQDEFCNSGFTCNITLTNIEGNDNTDGYGAELYTDASGNISVSNSFFNGSSDDNIYAQTGYYNCDNGTCNITITNVQANYSTGSHGIHLYTSYRGDVTINGGTFSNNNGDGIYAYAGSEGCDIGTCNINLDGVTSNDNTRLGGEFLISTTTGSNAAVDIKNSTFNTNGTGGLFLGGNWGFSEAGILPTFKLTNVTANGSHKGDGLQFMGPIDEDHGYITGDEEDVSNAAATILICSGSYNDNFGFGVNINNFGGTTTFDSSVVTTGNNLTGEVPGENWLNPEGGDCVEVSLGGGERTIKPMTYEYFSEAVNSQEKDFNCDSYLGLVIYTEELKDEDHVMIPCGSKGTGTHASAFKTLENELPVKPAVGTFVSALKLAIEDNEHASAIHTGQWMVSFKLPEGAKTSEYSIMFWNGIAWELVPNTFTVDGYFQSWVNMLGYYMLIKN